MANENTVKIQLHRHLQGYKNQTLSFEMVKDLMSFVFDMVKDPSVAWVSQDSHIRLLNGVFKKVGQIIDDKGIAGIEESIWSAFVFNNPPEAQHVIGRLLRSGRPAEATQPMEKAAASAPEIKDGSAKAADSEAFFRRLRLELIAFENRIAKVAETAIKESHESAKRAALDRIELESRLAIERAEIASLLSKGRSEYIACLEAQRDEVRNLLSGYLAGQEKRAKLADSAMDMRLHALESVMAVAEEQIKSQLHGQTDKNPAGPGKAESPLDARLISMEQKLKDAEEKANKSSKAFRRLGASAVFGLIATVAGFGAVIYLLIVRP